MAKKANKTTAKATKATDIKATAKPAAKPAIAPAAATLALHLNKTGRLCFGKDAADRMGDSKFMTLAIDPKGLVRIEPTNKAMDGALPLRDANGRPYISATRQFKPLGFDGSKPYDIEAKPYGNAGFEFRLS